MKLTDRLIHLLGGITQEEARDREHRLVVSHNSVLEFFHSVMDSNQETIKKLREENIELNARLDMPIKPGKVIICEKPYCVKKVVSDFTVHSPEDRIMMEEEMKLDLMRKIVDTKGLFHFNYQKMCGKDMPFECRAYITMLAPDGGWDNERSKT